MDARRRIRGFASTRAARAGVGVAVAAALLLGASGSASAHPEGATEAQLDAMDVEELEQELLSIERELAAVHHERFLLAMAARDPRDAGLALAAWRTHQAMAQALVPDAPRDHRLAARVALHARSLAIEGRAERGLAADAGAFARELASLEAAV